MDLETYALLKKKINNISANNISYDNSQSAGLISTNVNDALDELSTKLGIKMVTVSELPLVGDPDILYIVPKSTPEQGNYSDEYTWNVTRQDYDKVGDTLISPLPDVTSSDNGKVLGVVNGEWDKYTVPKELPTVSSSDNGKVLSVVSSSWNKKSLTKSDIGLGNVDNTSDLNKPISTATQSALDTKLSEDDLYNMTEDSTVSGNPVTLKTLAKTSAKSCEVTFSPIQSGSGEPSPENVRPISGRDSLHLYQDTEQTETPETIHTATFPSTIYGGSYEFVSGKLKSEWDIVDLSTLSWNYDSSGKRWQTSGLTTIKSFSTRSAELVSDRWKADITAQTGDEYKMFTVYKGLYFYTTDSVNSPTGTLVYPLATPREITLTAEQIELLKGNNTLWTDGDNIEIVYTELDLTELPDVTSADEGKVLTVDSNGDWIASTLPDGTNISY